MEQYQVNNQQNNETIDLFALLGKIAKKWYLFVISIGLFLALAYFYNFYSEKLYPVSASVYIKESTVGSTDANELVSDRPNLGSTLALSNEIGKLTSYSLVRSALEGLNFGMTYYHVEGFWPRFMRENWLKEIGSFPFTVQLDSSSNQLINTPIFIKPISETRYQVIINDDEANIFNFDTNSGSKAYDLDYVGEGEFGKPFQSDYVNFTVEKSDKHYSSDFEYAFKLTRIEDLAAQYQGKLAVVPLDEKDITTRILKISVNMSLPDKGVRFINSLLDAYSNQDLAKKNARGQNSLEFLNKQIALMGDSLKRAELALQNYKSSSSILDIDVAKGSVMGNLNALEQEKALLETKMRYYRNTLKNLQSNENSDRIIAPSSAGINEDPLFSQLIQKYIELNTRLRDLEATAQPDNPLVLQLNRQAASTRDAIIDGLNSAIETQTENLSSLNNRIYSIKNSINSLPQDERKLTILQREYDNYALKYNNLLDKKASAQMALATNTDNLDIVDPAKKIGYAPVYPNEPLNYALAFVIGLILPLGFVFIKDMTNNNITDKKELEKQTKAPLLGMIANGPKSVKIVSQKYPNSAIAESFKFARINLQYFHQGGSDKVIGVTSSISGEGKTFCSANLAVTFAESGKRTLLIGGDLRKPRIQDFFDLRGPGLTDYINDFATIDNVIQPTEFRNLDVIAPGSPQDDPIKLFESPKVEEMFKALRERYDHIIIETPPIGYVADYFVLIRHFDINLFVVRYNYTNKNILSGINDLYANNKIKNLYLLFNDVKYSAEYGYGYLSNSDGYYTNNYSVTKKLNGRKNKIKNPFA